MTFGTENAVDKYPRTKMFSKFIIGYLGITSKTTLLFVRAVTLLAMLASTLVTAAPPIVRASRDLVICDQPRLSAMSDQWSTASYIKANTDAPLKKAGVFWSGSINGTSVRDNAEICSAKARLDGYTVGMMMCNNGGFTMPSTNDTAASELWDTASRTFAQNAKGRVFAVFGTSVNPQGTWFRVEWPALQANKKVSAVLQLDPTSCASTCYWLCRDPFACWGLRRCPNAPDESSLLAA